MDHIEVGWTVGSEFNLDYYNLQRSENGIDFETIATVDAVGSTQSEQSYTYDDFNVGRNKEYYYRYQSFDDDSYSEYSPIVNARLNSSENFAESILLYPNPTTGNLFVELTLEFSSLIEMSVLNSAGQLVESSLSQGSSGNNVIALDANDWASGVYIVQISELRSGEVVYKKVIKD